MKREKLTQIVCEECPLLKECSGKAEATGDVFDCRAFAVLLEVCNALSEWGLLD